MSWIGAVDQGTTSTRFFVFDEKGKVVASARRPITLNTPRSGWVEQDPVELVDSVISCIDETCSDIDKRYGESAKKKIKAVGMANQRETVVAWDVVTGKPLHPAIVWMDSRNHEEIKRLAKTKEAVQIRRLSGLPISTYFSAGKMKWLLENVKLVQDAQRNGTLLFGTIDSWILYNLLKDRPHVTDVTNAHRTALVDLKSLKWNKTLAALQGLDLSTLPQIHPSTHTFGYFEKTKLAKVPVTAVLGDQHAALLGHGCLDPGQTKNTYGTGCFMLCNVGPKPVHTDDGLISTVAFQLGKNPSYALEASIASAASSFEWLKNKIGILSDTKAIGTVFGADFLL
jgi:glycerol kinase